MRRQRTYFNCQEQGVKRGYYKTKDTEYEVYYMVLESYYTEYKANDMVLGSYYTEYGAYYMVFGS